MDGFLEIRIEELARGFFVVVLCLLSLYVTVNLIDKTKLTFGFPDLSAGSWYLNSLLIWCVFL